MNHLLNRLLCSFINKYIRKKYDNHMETLLLTCWTCLSNLPNMFHSLFEENIPHLLSSNLDAHASPHFLPILTVLKTAEVKLLLNGIYVPSRWPSLSLPTISSVGEENFARFRWSTNWEIYEDVFIIMFIAHLVTFHKLICNTFENFLYSRKEAVFDDDWCFVLTRLLKHNPIQKRVQTNSKVFVHLPSWYLKKSYLFKESVFRNSPSVEG